MKIGIDIRNIGKKRTGDEAVFFNLVKNLALIDSQNEYFLFTDIIDADLLQNKIIEPLKIAHKNNFKIISLKCANKFVWNIWTLPFYLRKNPLDIYHTQYIIPFFVSKKIKIITTIHDISFNFFPQCIKWTDLFFLKILIPYSIRRADKIIAVSEFTKKEIIKYYRVNAKKIDVVLNAVSDNLIKNNYSNEELLIIRKKYGLPKKYILYLGTFEPRKNLPMIIAGFSHIRSQLPHYKLVLAGKKGYNYDRRIDKILQNLALKKSVIFTGYIENNEKAAVFRMADLFVTASLYEGFGITILEAMSQGTPVLASSIESHREVGVDAVFYFNPEDLDNLEKNMYNILVNYNAQNIDSDKLINRSMFFSWKKSADKLLSIYNKIL